MSGPRILFAGGSNLLFGLSSPLVQQAFPRFKVLNLGLNNGIGLRIYTRMIEPNLQKSDVVILTLEYSYFSQRIYGEACRSNEMLLFDPGLARYYDASQFLSGLPCLFYVTQALISEQIFPAKKFIAYEADDINSYGDNDGHRTFKTTGINPKNALDISDHVDPQVLQLLKEFKSQVESKGAKFYLAWPPFPKSSYKFYQSKIENIRNELTEALSASAILGDPSELTYPNPYFFDSEYHLNFDYKQDWTGLVIEKLKARGTNAL